MFFLHVGVWIRFHKGWMMQSCKVSVVIKELAQILPTRSSLNLLIGQVRDFKTFQNAPFDKNIKQEVDCEHFVSILNTKVLRLECSGTQVVKAWGC